MGLTNKATIIVGSALLATMFVSFGSAAFLLADDHRALEEATAQQRLATVEDHLRGEAQGLELTARETVQIAALVFASGQATDENASMELTQAMFDANDLDMIIFRFQQNGTWQTAALSIDGQGFGIVNITTVPASLFEHDDMAHSRSALFWLDGRPVLAGSHPMTMLDDIVGSLGVARFVDDLAGVVDADVALEAVATSGFSIERPDRDSVVARAPLVLDEAPVGTIRIQSDRSVFQNGLTALGWFVWAGAATVVVAIVMTAWMLHRFVTGPISRLSRKVQDMDPDAPDGAGEIEHLETSFDHMVARLRHEQDALAASNRELQSFASVVSHDLKSPLSTIRLQLASLRLEVPETERVVRKLDGSVARMAGRIEAVLAYSQAGGKQIRARPVPLDEVMRRVAADTQGAAREAQARLRIGRLPRVHGDPELLAQLFQNLITNSLKYRRMDVAPEISVTAERDGEQTIVIVRDNGRGFNDEEAQHMMEPFVRLAGADGTDGHGIGLATCQRIAHAHGGALEAKGLRDVGAEFRVRLPLSDGPWDRPPRPANVAAPVVRQA